MAQERKLIITRRRLPHWRLEGSVYFVTFRLWKGNLTPKERQDVLDHIKSGHEKFYGLYAVVVMPDHVHLLLQPNDDMSLSRVMKGIKGVSARKLNKAKGGSGRVWQDESYDRIVRHETELMCKTQYMLENPRRAGLVDDPWSYPFWYHNPQVFA